VARRLSAFVAWISGRTSFFGRAIIDDELSPEKN